MHLPGKCRRKLKRNDPNDTKLLKVLLLRFYNYTVYLKEDSSITSRLSLQETDRQTWVRHVQMYRWSKLTVRIV